jgi:BrnA antitoxin of type II toxin-antitoxin system
MTMRKEYDFSAGRRGAVIAPRRGKTRITIRLDDDLLDWFRARVDAAGGGSYQTLINDALRTFITAHEQPLEQLLRKVLREELHRVRPPSRSGSRRAA